MSKSTTEIVKKITIKSVCGTPTASEIKAAVKSDTEVLPRSMFVIGYAHDKKVTVNEDTGQAYEALSGEFLAYDKAKPEVQFQSGTLYLPPIAHDLAKAQLAKGSVEFALEIGFRLPREGEKSPTGYIYTVKPLIKPNKNAPLLQLLAKVQGGELEETSEPVAQSQPE